MSANNEYIGKRIKSLRNERHISQAVLSQEISVDKTTISGYERGRITPPLDVVVLLAKYFDVSTDYLLGITDYRYSAAHLGDPVCKGMTVGGFIDSYLALDSSSKNIIAVLVKKLMK